tara:strand:- start:189 stop:410 length:222 start_codon:yes stop_codon:yes gene_type:complete
VYLVAPQATLRALRADFLFIGVRVALLFPTHCVQQSIWACRRQQVSRALTPLLALARLCCAPCKLARLHFILW